MIDESKQTQTSMTGLYRSFIVWIGVTQRRQQAIPQAVVLFDVVVSRSLFGVNIFP